MESTNPAPLWAIAARKRYAAERHDERAARYRREAVEFEHRAREAAENIRAALAAGRPE